MGFFDGLVRGAQNFGKGVVNAQIPFTGPKPNQNISLADLGRNIAPAAVSGVVPMVKGAADMTANGMMLGEKLTGNKSRYDATKAAKDSTDETLKSWMDEAHQKLGITDNNMSAKIANTIPKAVGFGISLDSGVPEAAGLKMLFGGIAKAGPTAKAIDLIGHIGKEDPAVARMLTTYMAHPETDMSMFKALLRAPQAMAGKDLSAASKLTGLGNHVANGIGGTVGYSTMNGIEEGHSPEQIAHNIKMGLVGGDPVGTIKKGLANHDSAGKIGMDAFSQLPVAPMIEGAQAAAGHILASPAIAPHVAEFLKEAQKFTSPAVRQKMQEVGEHFIAAVHKPEAPAPIEPLHAPGTPLSEMNPTAMAAHQAQQAEQAHNLINANEIVKQKQAEAAQHDNPLVSVGNMVKDRVSQIKAKVEAQAKSELVPDPNHPGHLTFSPENVNSMVDMASGASGGAAKTEAAVAHEVQALTHEAPKTVPVKVAEPAPAPKMAPNETGSAHENQVQSPNVKLPTTQPGRSANQRKGDATLANILAKPEAPHNPEPPKYADPQLSKPALVQRTRDAKGNVTAITHSGTGETYSMKHDGSPISEYNNELIHENSAKYGEKGHDVSSVHEGRQKVLEYKQQAVVDHLNSNFTAEERTQITHLREGSLKPEDVSSKVKQAAHQLDEMDRLHYLFNKEAKRTMGEINNGTDNYVRHINLDAKGGKAKVGLGKFSTKSSSQQQREIVKLTSDSGRIQFGKPEDFNLEKTAEGHYVDKSGHKWYPSQATISELNNNGMHYETDAAKIATASMRDGAKTANNLKLGRNLTANTHEGDIIPRQAGETKPPKGYVESHIPGMENHWMSKAYHSHLYTNSDVSRSLGYKAVQLGGKVLGAPSRLVNNLFFAENSGYHQLINESAQAFVTAGAGSGKSGNIIKEAFRGVPNAAKTASQLKEANQSVVKHNEKFYEYLRDGGKTSQRAGIASKAVTGALGRLKAAGHSLNIMGKLGHGLAIHIGDTVRMAKYNELTKAGMSGKEAVKLIDSMQGDYSNLGRFEKEIVTNYVQFYPFFKHQLTSLGHATIGTVTNPGKYAGAATTAALLYGTYVAMDKGLQAATGNQYADIKKGGMLGLIDDVKKAPEQVKGRTDKAGVKHPGTLPSIASNRLNPVERTAIEQATGKSLVTNEKFDTSTKGRLTEAGKGIAEINQYHDTSTGKKSAAEVALNLNGVKLPHGKNTPAAPKLEGTAAGDLVNVSGHNAKGTIDAGTAAKNLGGSKLAEYQYARVSGDHSLDTFFAKNPKLDPLSKEFSGFNTSTAGVTAGSKLMKEAGGSSLTYMQSMKLSGNTTYDKFFTSHPDLDPTNAAFKGFKKAGSGNNGKTGVSIQNSKTSKAVAKATAAGHPKGVHHTAKAPGTKQVSLKLKTTNKVVKAKMPTIKSPSHKSVSLTKAKSPSTGHVKLKLQA